MSEPQQQQGIFEPKPLNLAHVPKSGAQKAVRVMIVLGVALVIWVAYLLLHNPFMRPVQKYYKGLAKDKPAAMCDAFPDWLVSTQLSTDYMTVNDMCVATSTNKKLVYGLGGDIKVALMAQEPIAEEKLAQLESGIKSKYGKNVRISKGVCCTLSVSYTPKGSNSIMKYEYVNVYKIDGFWMILDVPNTKK